MLAQQRELQLKKRQSAVQSGGMMRSSLDSVGSGSPMLGSGGGGGQFTPALRQFSQPKTLRDSHEASEFSRPVDDMRGSQSFAKDKGARKARYGVWCWVWSVYGVCRYACMHGIWSTVYGWYGECCLPVCMSKGLINQLAAGVPDPPCLHQLTPTCVLIGLDGCGRYTLYTWLAVHGVCHMVLTVECGDCGVWNIVHSVVWALYVFNGVLV
ncbi:hypothetical protein EON63_19470 [archaeon]|nr:MAG: hypothetical protein EON63_19470 [archaeon]